MHGPAAGARMTPMLRPPDSDRVLDWRDEWRRIERRLADLPVEARVAVLQLVERFRSEDAAQDRAA